MRAAAAIVAVLLLAACGTPPAPPPHQIRLVGGAAGFPLATEVAERFMRDRPDAIAPLVRAGGDGPAIERFCGGLGPRHPDLALVSRAMTAGERARCAANGVSRIATVPIGWTATVVAARPPAPFAAIASAALDRAIAGGGTRWSTIDPALPDAAILLDGPGPADRTLAVVPRRDGTYRAHGADADLAAAAAAATPGAIALLPYAAWWRHRDTLAAIRLDGVAPAPASIATGRYPGRRPLLLVTKASEAAAVPGMRALLRLVSASLDPAGPWGSRGLVALDAVQRRGARCALATLARDAAPPYCHTSRADAPRPRT